MNMSKVIARALLLLAKFSHKFMTNARLERAKFSMMMKSLLNLQCAFHRFGQAKFPYGGLVLGSSQFTLQPRLPLKMMLWSKSTLK
jgi:hypothetical protein